MHPYFLLVFSFMQYFKTHFRCIFLSGKLKYISPIIRKESGNLKRKVLGKVNEGNATHCPPTFLVLIELLDHLKATTFIFISSHAWHCYALVFVYYVFLFIGLKSYFLISKIVFVP